MALAATGGVLALGFIGAADAHHIFASGGPEKPWIEFAFEKQTPARNHITENFSLGGEVEVEFASEDNYNLDDADDEDESALKPLARLFASYEPTENFRAYSKFEFSQDFFLRHPDNDSPDAQFEVKEAYLAFRDIAPGLTAIIGRQDIEDEREWVADRVLDGVRVVQRFGDFAVEAVAGRQDLVQRDLLGDHDDDKADNYYVRGFWGIREDSQASLYALYQDGRNGKDEDRLFLGVQSFGMLADNLDYWAEGAFVLGEAEGRDVRGFGFDIGGTYVFKDAPMRPAATLGFAFGTGDDGSGTDTAFRQSGLQDNNSRFGGVTSFKYLGEVFEPEISNLAILTAGVGVRPTKRSSVDLVYHNYMQHRRSDEIRDSNIDADPSGLSRDIGQEIDLVIGVKEFEDIAIEAVAGVFLPGDAFETNDHALFLNLTITKAF